MAAGMEVDVAVGVEKSEVRSEDELLCQKCTGTGGVVRNADTVRVS